MYIIGEPAPFKIVLALPGHIQHNDPSAVIFELLLPLFIITIVAAMEVEHVLRDKDEFADTVLIQDIGYVPAHRHDVILNRVVPFSQQFNDRVMLFIVSKQSSCTMCVSQIRPTEDGCSNYRQFERIQIHYRFFCKKGKTHLLRMCRDAANCNMVLCPAKY